MPHPGGWVQTAELGAAAHVGGNDGNVDDRANIAPVGLLVSAEERELGGQAGSSVLAGETFAWSDQQACETAVMTGPHPTLRDQLNLPRHATVVRDGKPRSSNGVSTGPRARYGRFGMVIEGPAEVLQGRREEREVLDRLLAAVRDGQSRVLVVSGEPGVGKTALLQSAIRSASGFRVARTVGVESEMELAFAALQQLCAPMLDRLDRLPAPQQEALGVAFGLRAGNPPDRFLVGLAVLSLFSEVAEGQPLVCVVDDAQWLDRASVQALAFVARRLLVESVALLFATRDPGDELEGLPRLVVEGLRNGDARALLGSVLRVPLDDRVRERIVAETRGNPLALLELPRGATPAELAGGFGLLDTSDLSGRIEDSFRRRLAGLRADTQRLLLVAAAEPVGDPVLVWRAAGRLDIGVQAAAETDGLLAIGARVTFRHPLVRSAVYRAAAPEDRQAVHRALAEVTDPAVDPDRRAWHLAQATPGFDEDVASELERSAGRAQARGGLSAAAAFLERATRLTLDPARRAERALAAAQAKYHAGALDVALGLVAIADSGPLTEFQCAQVDVLRAQIAFAVNRGRDAPPLLLKAAKRLESLDARVARETYLDALTAAVLAHRLATGVGLVQVADAVRTAPPVRPPRASDLLLDGWVSLITEGYQAGTPMLKRALQAFRGNSVPRDEEIRWLWLACHTAYELWDADTWRLFSERLVELAHEAGALVALPIALDALSSWALFAGDFARAASLVEEGQAITEVIGSHPTAYGPVLLAACQGREDGATALIESSSQEVVRRGEGMGLTVIHWASAILHNGLGRYEDALNAARQASEDPHDPPRALPELIEAATRCGVPAGRCQRPRAALEYHSGQRHRLGARDRGMFAGAAERRRPRGAALPRVD